MNFEEYIVKVYANGEKQWYQNGELHRTDGPAIECADGNGYGNVGIEVYKDED